MCRTGLVWRCWLCLQAVSGAEQALSSVCLFQSIYSV